CTVTSSLVRSVFVPASPLIPCRSIDGPGSDVADAMNIKFNFFVPKSTTILPPSLGDLLLVRGSFIPRIVNGEFIATSSLSSLTVLLSNNPGKDMRPVTDTNAFFDFTGLCTATGDRWFTLATGAYQAVSKSVLNFSVTILIPSTTRWKNFYYPPTATPLEDIGYLRSSASTSSATAPHKKRSLFNREPATSADDVTTTSVLSPKDWEDDHDNDDAESSNKRIKC
ncbi:uncharacterized protein EI90DRAFT_3182193, partial [Cantharellus anzutake]|uniref:uncharacterized protein n=1 Tax=Cantharellus anzutake TaxID=1750568 RepID=UPI0019072F45